MQRLLVVPWSRAATSVRWRVGLIPIVGPFDGHDGPAHVTCLPEPGRDRDDDPGDDADERVLEEPAHEAAVEILDMDPAEDDQDPVDRRSRAADRREPDDQPDRDAEQERAGREDRAD